MFRLGTPELLIILVIVLLLFGPGRLGKIGGEIPPIFLVVIRRVTARRKRRLISDAEKRCGNFHWQASALVPYCRYCRHRNTGGTAYERWDQCRPGNCPKTGQSIGD